MALINPPTREDLARFMLGESTISPLLQIGIGTPGVGSDPVITENDGTGYERHNCEAGAWEFSVSGSTGQYVYNAEIAWDVPDNTWSGTWWFVAQPANKYVFAQSLTGSIVWGNMGGKRVCIAPGSIGVAFTRQFSSTGGFVTRIDDYYQELIGGLLGLNPWSPDWSLSEWTGTNYGAEGTHLNSMPITAGDLSWDAPNNRFIFADTLHWNTANYGAAKIARLWLKYGGHSLPTFLLSGAVPIVLDSPQAVYTYKQDANWGTNWISVS